MNHCNASFAAFAVTLCLSGCFVQPAPTGPAYYTPEQQGSGAAPPHTPPGPEAYGEEYGQQEEYGQDYIAPTPGDLRPHAPVACSGNQELQLEGVYIDAPDVAVHVTGNCSVRITGSHVAGGRYGIVVAGNGDVHIHSSTIEGSAGAFNIRGNGDIAAQGSRFLGGQTVVGNGDFEDQGDNAWQ